MIKASFAVSRMTQFVLALVVLALTTAGVPVMADDPTLPPPEEYIAPEVTDLSGDEVEDLMLVSPLGDVEGASPGKIVIESGEGGQMMTLNGGQNNDWFGYSVAVIPDLNFDGFDELLVGAPRHGTGRAYLFYGPFNDIGVEELTIADADYTFSSPHAGVYNFGAKVAPLHDVTNDDVHDLRIRSFFMNGGQPVMRTYIYSGVTLELLTTIIGTTPFDPWAVINGDTDNDADVDGDDLNTVVTNQGLTGNLTTFDGDLNSDGTVNGGDLTIVSAGLGQAHFAGHVGGGGTGGPWSYSLICGAGSCYVYNCECELVCQADCDDGCMSFLECNPPLCPGGGCAVYIEHEPEATVQCVLEDMTVHAYGPPESEGGYLWSFITGGSLVQMQGPAGGQTIHFRLKKLGKVKPKVYRNWCGGCEAQDLIISVWIDSDDDGLPDAIEDDVGTSPDDPDSDGDGTPDGQEDFDGDGLTNGTEVSQGFDPGDDDSDNDGTPDGQDNPPPGGGVQPPSCGSFEQDINLAWMCGDPVSADGPITVCEDEAEECDCWTFHVTDEAGGTDDYWFVVGNPPGASIDGDPDQDRTSPCIDLDGPGSFEIGVISQLGGAFCMATQTVNIVDVTFTPDPETHQPGATGAMVLPGDIEKVTAVTNADSADLWYTIANSQIARFEQDGEFVDSVESDGASTELKVLGRNAGVTQIQVRVGSATGDICESFPVIVGGTIEVRYDQSPTYVPSGPPIPGGGVAGGGPYQESILGGLPIQAGPDPAARLPISQETMDVIMQHVPEFKAKYRVTILDANGNPKKGKEIFLHFRDGYVSSQIGFTPGMGLAGLPLTNADGFFEDVLAADHLQGEAAEQIKIERIAVFVGRAAREVATSELSAEEIEVVHTLQQYAEQERTWRGSYTKIEQNLNQYDGEEHHTALASRLAVMDHFVTSTLRCHTSGPNYSNILEGMTTGPSTDILIGFDPAGFPIYGPVNLQPSQLIFENQYILDNVIIPQVTTWLEDHDIPVDIDWDVEGAAVNAASLLAEIGLAMVPGGDIIDIFKETIYKPFFLEEDTNYYIGVAALVGLMADAGYLTGPGAAAGVAVNLMAAGLKVVIKYVSPELVKVLFTTMQATVRENVFTLLEYLSKVPVPEGLGPLDSVVHMVEATINQLNKLTGSPLQLLPANIAESVALVTGRSAKTFNDEAAEGVAAYIKLGDEGADAIDDLFTKIEPGSAGGVASEVTSESVESIGTGIGRTYQDTVPGAPNPDPHGVQRVDEAIAAANRQFDPHLRSSVASHLGPSSAIKTMEEFEALRMVRYANLDPAQQTAIRTISHALSDIPNIPVGTPMYKAISNTEAYAKIAGGDPNLSGFLTFGDDMAGQMSSGQVIDRLRLDYDGSPFVGGETYVVLETPMTESLRASTKIPRSPDYGAPGSYEVIDESPFPFTGHGLTASMDGHLARELKMASGTPMQVDTTVMKFKNADGSPRVIQIGELSGETWVLHAHPSNPALGLWLPQ